MTNNHLKKQPQQKKKLTYHLIKSQNFSENFQDSFSLDPNITDAQVSQCNNSQNQRFRKTIYKSPEDQPKMRNSR